MRKFDYTYEDHISSIVKEAEKKGSFDHLPGKGNLLILIKMLRTILKSNFIEL